MRHKRKKSKLNRTTSHRKALASNLVRNLMIHESIKTTLSKAKYARTLADKIISLAKKDTLDSKRGVYSILNNHKLTSKIFKEIAPRFKDRSGGYTRIIPLSARKGDGAQMAMLSLVEIKAKTRLEPETKKEVKKKEKEPKQEKKTKKPKQQEKEKPPKEEEKKSGFLSNLRNYLGKGKGSE